MKNFHHTGLWAMLNDPNAINGFAQADAALNEFTEELHGYCREGDDLAERTRTLRLTRDELVTAHERTHYGAEKKCHCPLPC